MKQVLVLGDLMLDTYTSGDVVRISPEAPVPVHRPTKIWHKPGGAGNAAINIAAMECKVHLAGRIGADAAGYQVLQALSNEGLGTDGLFQDTSTITPQKNRILARGQQLLRIDTEDITPLSSAICDKLLAWMEALAPQLDLIAISDYGKGLLTQELLSATFALAQRYALPVVVDPKGLNFAKYKGASLIKPNKSEAYAAAGMEATAPLEAVADRLMELTEASQILITLSEDGMMWFTRGEPTAFSPARSSEVRDVTGAGDTVLAAVCYGLANHLSPQEIVDMSAQAAGLAVSHVGCAVISLSQIKASASTSAK